MSKRFLKYETENENPSVNNGVLKLERKIFMHELVPCVNNGGGEFEPGCNCFYDGSSMSKIDLYVEEDLGLNNIKPGEHIEINVAYDHYNIVRNVIIRTDYNGCCLVYNDDGIITNISVGVYLSSSGEYCDVSMDAPGLTPGDNFYTPETKVMVNTHAGKLKSVKFYKITHE